MESTALRNTAEQVSVSIIEAVAAASDVDASSLDTPLYQVVDTDALDALVSSSASVRVAFEYEDHDVVVSEDRTISVDGEIEGSI